MAFWLVAIALATLLTSVALVLFLQWLLSEPRGEVRDQEGRTIDLFRPTAWTAFLRNRGAKPKQITKA
jgi:hypothetical protein